MPSRRFHTKSRAGCTQCRSRKTKCDESKPKCSKCSMRGLTCSFAESALVIIPSRSAAHSTASQGPKSKSTLGNSSSLIQPAKAWDDSQTSAVDFSLGCTLRGDENDVLRLTHYYALCTCKTIADTSLDTLPLWRDVVPGLAYHHDFLLHILLGVTALHLNIVHPSTENSKAALQNYTKGLALFRPQLTDITPRNISALFAFSCLLPLYSFGINCTSISTSDTLSEIVEILTLLRGVSNIVSSGSQLLRNGPFGSLIPPNISDPTRALSEDLEATLSALSIRNQESTKPSSRDAFADTISILRQTFLLERELRGKTMTVVPFAISILDPFVDGMRERDPMALVILAHYAIILHWLSRIIWLQDWGSRIVNAVRDFLSEEWMDCMAWPIVQVNGRLKAL